MAPTIAPQLQDRRDPTTEKWLKDHGATFRLEEIPVADIDQDRSHHNQARIGAPINEDTVLMYAIAMTQGDVFPPVVVYRNGGDRAITIDGNHRVSATIIREMDTIAAYVIDQPSEVQIRTLTFEANTKHGLPTGLAERLNQAIFLVNLGSTQAEAANLLNIPPQKVANAVSVYKADRRLVTLGIKRVDKLNTMSRMRLNSLHSDEVFKVAVELVQQTRMPSDEVSSLVTAINKGRTEREQIEMVRAERDRRKSEIKATAGGRVQLPSRITWLSRALGTLSRTDVDGIAHDIATVAPELRDSMRENVRRAAATLAKIEAAL